jgi:hypothetical protein
MEGGREIGESEGGEGRGRGKRRITHVYELLNALKLVRKGIVRGLLSAISWHVT